MVLLPEPATPMTMIAETADLYALPAGLAVLAAVRALGGTAASSLIQTVSPPMADARADGRSSPAKTRASTGFFSAPAHKKVISCVRDKHGSVRDTRGTNGSTAACATPT